MSGAAGAGVGEGIRASAPPPVEVDPNGGSWMQAQAQVGPTPAEPQAGAMPDGAPAPSSGETQASPPAAAPQAVQPDAAASLRQGLPVAQVPGGSPTASDGGAGDVSTGMGNRLAGVIEGAPGAAIGQPVTASSGDTEIQAQLGPATQGGVLIGGGVAFGAPDAAAQVGAVVPLPTRDLADEKLAGRAGSVAGLPMSLAAVLRAVGYARPGTQEQAGLEDDAGQEVAPRVRPQAGGARAPIAPVAPVGTQSARRDDGLETTLPGNWAPLAGLPASPMAFSGMALQPQPHGPPAFMGRIAAFDAQSGRPHSSAGEFQLERGGQDRPWVAATWGNGALQPASAWTAALPGLLTVVRDHADQPITQLTITLPVAEGHQAAALNAVSALNAPAVSGVIGLADGRVIRFGRPDIPGALGSGPRAKTPSMRVDLRIRAVGVGDGSFREQDRIVTYQEARQVPIDLAPVLPVVPLWRLDDTRALVRVGPAGDQAAASRAACLFRDLMEAGGGLEVLQPGEGFATWEGSPLWLSLAGVAKPSAQGVLMGTSVAARIEVFRDLDGAWEITHAGGDPAVPRATRWPPAAVDSEALLLDALYGVGEPGDPLFAGVQAARAAAALEGDARRKDAQEMLARHGARAAAHLQLASLAGDAPPGLMRLFAEQGAAACLRVWHGAAPPLVAAALCTVAGLDWLLSARAAPAPFRPAREAGTNDISLALRTGDPARVAASFGTVGQRVVAALAAGHTDSIGPLESIAQAMTLARLVGPRPGSPVPADLRGVAWDFGLHGMPKEGLHARSF